ncbi:hypothetical protein AK812_SmicGene4032 [Symbiodinium microadriaticum]|uniref:Uncharacterized protein n=1 Tax=Symbiodinium microadriaticum TaxID=2951 RepID=A0A1Q9EXA3_SYMMI|nr:hypothetical protein AK812_SmicGene4032 [Symbiodinium microadriaticum]
MPTALLWLQRAEKAGAALDKADFTALIECAVTSSSVGARLPTPAVATDPHAVFGRFRKHMDYAAFLQQRARQVENCAILTALRMFYWKLVHSDFAPLEWMCLTFEDLEASCGQIQIASELPGLDLQVAIRGADSFQQLSDDFERRPLSGADSFQQLSDDFERRPLSGSEDSARFWLEKLKVVNLDEANEASCGAPAPM